jgi:hypothetical protein
MARPKGVQLTEKFFEVARQYLSGKNSVAGCAKKLNQPSPNTFSNWLNAAYDQGYLRLETNDDNETQNLLTNYINASLKKVIFCNVTSGQPDNEMFALFAAEKILYEIRTFLYNKNKDSLNIGIVSGTSTGETINQLVRSRLWDDLINNEEVKPVEKEIRIIALNITPAHGRELYGNAIASVVALSSFIQEKLPACTVTPYGLTSPLVVDEIQRRENDRTNKEAIRFVDPTRCQPSEDRESELDIVITGVGSTVNSVFTQAIENVDIEMPKEFIGDVAYIPVDIHGELLHLKKKHGGEEVFIYTLLSAKLMKRLVNQNKKVLLIARNTRMFKDVKESDRPNKIQAIKAAILGGFCNSLITDRNTALGIMNKENT